MLSKQAIAEFKAIWKDRFGEDITDENADIEGTRLLQLMKLIYKPIPKNRNVKSKTSL